jgi:hypothetical protein
VVGSRPICCTLHSTRRQAATSQFCTTPNVPFSSTMECSFGRSWCRSAAFACDVRTNTILRLLSVAAVTSTGTSLVQQRTRATPGGIVCLATLALLSRRLVLRIRCMSSSHLCRHHQDRRLSLFPHPAYSPLFLQAARFHLLLSWRRSHVLRLFKTNRLPLSFHRTRRTRPNRSQSSPPHCCRLTTPSLPLAVS